MRDSFSDWKLTNYIKTTTTIYTIQTEVTHNTLASSSTTAIRLGGGGGGY